jgi:hypothetical protein
MSSHSLPIVWRVTLIPLILFEFLAVLGVWDIEVDYTTLGLFVTSTTVLLGLEFTYVKIDAKLHPSLHWWAVLPVLTATLFDAAGDFLHWYSLYPLYDASLHFVGSFAAAAFLWNVFTVFFSATQHRRLLLWATFTSAIACGVLYELEEYLEDLFFASNRLGDGPDTGNDLLLNVLGALTVVLVITAHRAFTRQRSKS